MSIQHHSPEEQAASNRLLDDILNRSQREWPHKRISGDDDGETAFALAVDVPHRAIRIQFSKPMQWIGFDSVCAKQLAEKLYRMAEQLESELARISKTP